MLESSINLATATFALGLASIVLVKYRTAFHTTLGRALSVALLLLGVWSIDRVAAPDPWIGYHQHLDAASDVMMVVLLAGLVIITGRAFRQWSRSARTRLLMIERAASEMTNPNLTIRERRRMADLISASARSINQDITPSTPPEPMPISLEMTLRYMDAKWRADPRD
jgi:hypothetical protein